MAITYRQAFSLALAYSGGAVPDFHRSSLFVDHHKPRRPTTNTRYDWGSYRIGDAVSSSRSKESVGGVSDGDKWPKNPVSAGSIGARTIPAAP